MKGMLHIYNDCTIDWHKVCANMWSSLGRVAHTKYHPSYIKYAGKQRLYNWLAPSMCKYVKRFGLSRAHKVPPIWNKVCRKTKLFATLSWIWNKVKVKMKGMLHIYNDCTIDWLAPSMCKYVKRFGQSRAHKVPPVLYKVCRKTKFFVTFSWIWNEVKVKMKVCCTSTMIVQLIVIKCVQICEAVWAESRTQSTTPIRDGRTHGHEPYVPRSGYSPHGGQ